MIKRQVQNLKRLVDDLLDVSRISRGKIELRKELVELAAVVAQAVEAVRPLFDEHRQDLHVSIPEEPILLKADPTRLEQILFNLLINAAKYTPRGGEIWLDVEPLRERSHHPCSRHGYRHRTRFAPEGLRSVLAGRTESRSALTREVESG